MADTKSVTVVTGKLKVGEQVTRGGLGRVETFEPVTVQIASEKDMTAAVIFKGPTKEKVLGGRTLSCYVTVDAKRLRFDEAGNLVDDTPPVQRSNPRADARRKSTILGLDNRRAED